MGWHLELLSNGNYNLKNDNNVIAEIIEQETIEDTDKLAYLINSAPILLDAILKIKAELLRCDMLDERTEQFIEHTISQTKKP